jgi:integrase
MKKSSKGGRPPTGSPIFRNGRWHARLGAERTPFPLDPSIPQQDEARAKVEAKAAAIRVRDLGLVPIGRGETVREWCDRWVAMRKERGITTVKHDAGRLKNHVFPIIGDLDVRAVSREDIERVVDHLDAKIRSNDPKTHIEWKTASNCWVLVTKMFDDAVNAKRKDIRCRETNPTDKVKAPDRGARKAKQYLYPSEFERLVSCKAVDIAFRTLYAAAVYTYARAGELEALTWDDVDLEHGAIHITKAVARDTGEVKSTKSGDTRRIPIEAELAPLLRHLKKQHDAEATHADDSVVKPARCFWMPSDEDRAVMLRQHLATAQVKRGELLDPSDAHRRHIVFHDLRATGITWAAARGDDPLRIKQRAGHRSFSTTEGYIREAENLAGGFGEPFPPLPSDLTGGVLVEVLGFGSAATILQPESSDTLWSKGGSNP